MEENKTSELVQEATAKIHPLLLLREVANKIIAIILVVITVMSCAYIACKWAYKPRYDAKATFVVSVKNGSTSVYSNLSAAQSAAKSFSKVICSDAMKKQIAAELGVKKINGNIDANIVPETNIMEIRVSASSPKEAFNIITAIIDNYGSLSEKVLNNVVLDALQYPTIPTYPTNPLSIKRPIGLSGIIAALATIVLVCFVTYVRDTVKVPKDVEEKLDTKSLGMIKHENKYKTLKSKIRREKTSILITKATTGFEFVETFKKLRTRIDYTMRKSDYKVLMVNSALEDEGKSTVAVNIALAMKRKYKNVLIIDADMKKAALHKILDYQDRKYSTLNSVLKGEIELEDAIVNDAETGLKILFAENCDEQSTELLNSERLREILTQARERMDVVVIDTPPMTVGLDAECVAEVADAAVIVVAQNKAHVRIINDMIDVIDASHAELLGCVLNNFGPADLDDVFSTGHNRYGYGRYGYGKYAQGDADRKYGMRSTQSEEGAQ